MQEHLLLIMTKWADFLITDVCYQKNPKRIKKIKQLIDNGSDTPMAGGEAERLTVVGNLKKGVTYMTVTRGKNGLEKGSMVIKYEENGELFIRTDPDEKKEDNLGELPEFNCQ
jgi:hypothetical protein